MFGMGFTEILMIAVVAILFLGPDKLPDAMVQIAKFFNSIRKTVNEAKSTFEEELHIQQLREEAMNYRQSLRRETEDLAGFKHTLDRSAKELDEALQSTRRDLTDLQSDEELYDDWEEEEKRELSEKVQEYKAMARKALEESRDLEDSPGEKTEADPAKKQAKPSGFKHHSEDNA